MPSRDFNDVMPSPRSIWSCLEHTLKTTVSVRDMQGWVQDDGWDVAKALDALQESVAHRGPVARLVDVYV